MCHKDVKIFSSFEAYSLQFYINMDDYAGVRPEDGILTLYCVSFDFAAHTDRINTMYCFNLRI